MAEALLVRLALREEDAETCSEDEIVEVVVVRRLAVAAEKAEVGVVEKHGNSLVGVVAEVLAEMGLISNFSVSSRMDLLLPGDGAEFVLDFFAGLNERSLGRSATPELVMTFVDSWEEENLAILVRVVSVTRVLAEYFFSRVDQRPSLSSILDGVDVLGMAISSGSPESLLTTLVDLEYEAETEPRFTSLLLELLDLSLVILSALVTPLRSVGVTEDDRSDASSMSASPASVSGTHSGKTAQFPFLVGVVTLLPPSASDLDDLRLLLRHELLLAMLTLSSSPIVSLELRLELEEELKEFSNFSKTSLELLRLPVMVTVVANESWEECEPLLTTTSLEVAPILEAEVDMASKDFFLSAIVNEEDREAGFPKEVMDL